MEVFREVGRLVEDLWRTENYSEAAFPAIAARALVEIDLAERGVTPWEIIRWLYAVPDLPKQQDIEATFGNPPLTLYCGSRFYIDIYYWLDGTTDIHQHGFAGAFRVLTGSSIHSRYSFQEGQRINEHFLLGHLQLNDVELLHEGDIRQIHPGREHIHSLFHLDRPSCTITVRTYGVASQQPQYSYRKPCLAIDPFYKEASLVRKLQTVFMLLNFQAQTHDDLIGDLLTTSDLQTAFAVLEIAFKLLRANRMEEFFQLSTSHDRFDNLMQKARQKHGDLVESFLPVFQEEARQADIVQRRQFITGPEHRFFLALLLNVPSGEKILALVQDRFPARRPLDKVLDWVLELSTTKVWGSPEANVLGLKDFDDDYLFVLECLLQRCSLEQIRNKLSRDYPAEYAVRLERRFDTIATALRQSTLLTTMLAQPL